MEDIEDSEVDDAECNGLSFGLALAVDREDSMDVTVLWRRYLSGLAVVVEAIVNGIRW